MLKRSALALTPCLLFAPTTALAFERFAPEGTMASNHPEATPYDPALDADQAVDVALARAGERETLVMLIMGANWCHDSRALAGWLETPRFQALLREHFEPVFVDIGAPQTGEGTNLHLARRFGIENLPGTPNLLVIAADGTLLNLDTATGWRNAASRSGDEIYDELARFADGRQSVRKERQPPFDLSQSGTASGAGT